ncbi:hypothetical protein V8F20_004698 [Naviculisporaceae sp. PSN 640]
MCGFDLGDRPRCEIWAQTHARSNRTSTSQAPPYVCTVHTLPRGGLYRLSTVEASFNGRPCGASISRRQIWSPCIAKAFFSFCCSSQEACRGYAHGFNRGWGFCERPAKCMQDKATWGPASPKRPEQRPSELECSKAQVVSCGLLVGRLFCTVSLQVWVWASVSVMCSLALCMHFQMASLPLLSSQRRKFQGQPNHWTWWSI